MSDAAVKKILTEALIGKVKGEVSFLLTPKGEVFFQSNSNASADVKEHAGAIGKKLAEAIKFEGNNATAIQVDVNVGLKEIKKIVINGMAVESVKGSGCMLSKRG